MALEQIIEYKKSLLEQKKPLVELYKKEILPASKSLYQALSLKRCAYILEIKFASPSEGVINDRLSVSQVAEIYSPFANAMSVLACEKFFGGSVHNVKLVSQQQSCPVLFKDVIVSPLQVIEARFYGAHAVLLMLSVLNDEEYRACEKTALELNMDVICEVHDEEEMNRAKKLSARIVGINNRNLKDLKIDLSTTDRLIPLAKKDALIICESGILNRNDLLRFRDKVDAFLIGTSLMRHNRVDLALRELLFGRVKICGLTNAVDAQEAYRNGAYYGGLNFSPLSKRCISVSDASDIVKSCPLKFGGVFVNQPFNFIIETAHHLNLDFVQLHGDESERLVFDLKKELSPIEVWKAVLVKDGFNPSSYADADRIVFDSYVHNEYGGTGQSFDWDLIPQNMPKERLVIAGGISEDNVLKAAGLSVFVVDVASGVEDGDPRKKSSQKLQNLFSQLKP